MISEYNRLRSLYFSTENTLEKAKYKKLIQEIVLPKMDEMLSVIKELYGDEVFNDYEKLIKENT